jgi:hypothetical protein
MVILLLLAAATEATAQYYDRPEYEPSRARFLSGGFVNRDFEPRSSNTYPDSLLIRYKRVMPMIGFSQGPVDLSFGYAQFTLHSRSRSTIFFGVTVANELPLTCRSSAALLLPVIFSADYTKAQGFGTEREVFNIASVGVGAGLKFRYYARSVDFAVRLVEIAHFSTEGFGAGSGFSAAMVGDAVLLLHEALVFDGVALGYRFRLQTWSMNESRFDYRSVSHGPFIGVLF